MLNPANIDSDDDLNEVVCEVRSSNARALDVPAALPRPRRLARLDLETLDFVAAYPHTHSCRCNAYLQWTLLLVDYVRAPDATDALVPMRVGNGLIAFDRPLDEATKAALRVMVRALVSKESS